MGRQLLREGEGAWRTVALERLPADLTWKGFCIKMGWPGFCPKHYRARDRMPLSFYLKAAEVLGCPPLEYLAAVLEQMELRQTSE